MWRERPSQHKNDNEKRMVNFTLVKYVAVTGRWYQHKDVHYVMWRSPDNKMYDQIDHILVARRHCVNVCYMTHMRVAEVESHHF
jgi:hypothetical protein